MSTAPARLDVRGILLFCVAAFGLSWFLIAGVLFSGAGPKAASLTVRAMGFMPVIATLLVWRLHQPQEKLFALTGVGFGKPGSGKFFALAWFGAPLLFMAALGLSALLGTFDHDFTGLSNLSPHLAQNPGAEKILETVPPQRFVWVQVLSASLLGPIFMAVLVFGEEWGWRGYLFPKLLPLGVPKALLLSGMLWGLWRVPGVLLGNDYPLHPRLGVAAIIVSCTLVGVLVGFLRWRTGSVLPGLFAMASVMAFREIPAYFARAGAIIDSLQMGLTGWPGWLLLAPLAAGCLVIASHTLTASRTSTNVQPTSLESLSPDGAPPGRGLGSSR